MYNPTFLDILTLYQYVIHIIGTLPTMQTGKKMLRKINLLQKGFGVDGLPKKPLNGVYEAKIINLRVRTYNFKNGACGAQTEITVGFSHEGEGMVREIILQHPYFKEAIEKPSVLQIRGARFRAFHASLQLSIEETEQMSVFADFEALTNDYSPLLLREPAKCVKCGAETEFSVSRGGKNYPVCEEHTPCSICWDLLTVESAQQFLIGRDCFVEIKDPQGRERFSRNRFLPPEGYKHLKDQAQTEPVEKVVITEVQGEAPQDDFGGE